MVRKHFQRKSLVSNFEQAVRRIGLMFGVDIRRISHTELSILLRNLFEDFQITEFYDIGANSGQFGNWLRGAGYEGTLVSFEPVSENFSKLKRRCDRDSNWIARHYAVGGNYRATSIINVSSNSGLSSSLLSLESNGDFEVPFKYINSEAIDILPISEAVAEHSQNMDGWLAIKSDTQGYERFIFDTDSFRSIAHRVKIVILESAVISSYEGAWKIHEALGYFDRMGFQLILVDSELIDSRGYLVEANIVLINRNS